MLGLKLNNVSKSGPWCQWWYGEEKQHRQRNILTYIKHLLSTNYRCTLSANGNCFSGIQVDKEAMAAQISNMKHEISALQMEKRELKINNRELTLDYRELNTEYQKLINETSEATTSVKRSRYMFCGYEYTLERNFGIFLLIIGGYIYFINKTWILHRIKLTD